MPRHLKFVPPRQLFKIYFKSEVTVVKRFLKVNFACKFLKNEERDRTEIFRDDSCLVFLVYLGKKKMSTFISGRHREQIFKINFLLFYFSLFYFKKLIVTL